MKKILSFLIALVPLAAFSQAGQNAAATDTVIKSVTSKLDTYTANHSVEKAYLQFDKPYYAVGDTMYFKAYVTLGPQHKLSALSGILYVDLIGPNNKISQSIKLPVMAGVAWGDFTLDESLKSGTYRVRAYTRWMRNEGANAFFEKTIVVGSPGGVDIAGTQKQGRKTSAEKSIALKPDVQFLPEGGNLAAGNYSKIAFKAVGPDGLAREVKGTITDNDGTEVTTFESTHLGMGAFNIVPHGGATYKANLTFADGTTNTVELPKAVNTGYTINLNNTNPDTIRIRITAGSETPQGPVNLVAQSGGVIYYAAQSGPFAKFFTAVIPKSKFPTGIAQFTVFSQAGEPLNERLAFIQNRDELKLDINTRPAYTFRQKVKVDLVAKNKNGKPANGSFSVSVIDETKVPADEVNENTIVSSLLLTSVLKGNIEQPNYYFTNTSEKTNADLDVLMLTQGYRHFVWKQILNENAQPPAYQPEKGLTISGTVKRGSKPAAGAKLSLISKSGGLSILDTVADDKGRFAFNNLSFPDTTKFVVQSKVPKGQDNVTLKLDSTSLPNVTIENAPIIQNSADITTYVNSQKRFLDEQEISGINKQVHQLKEVTIKTTRADLVPHSENLNGKGNADQLVSAKDLERYNCARIAYCLSGVLTGVIFRNGVPYNQRASQAPMAILIDGVYSEATDLDNLNIDDIEGIEVIISAHYGVVYGTQMANGGLIITSKRGRKSREYYRYAPGVVTFKPRGYYMAREFYSPQFDDSKISKKITNDLRSTIFWKPDIITDKNGRASFTFFNADSKGTYRMVIEGIDTEGNLGRQVIRYNVE